MKVFAPNSQSFNLCSEYRSYATVAENEKHWDTINANTSLYFDIMEQAYLFTHLHIEAAVILSSSIFQLLQLQLRIPYPVLLDLYLLLKFIHQF